MENPLDTPTSRTNISLVASLLGTNYIPETSGRIFFIEDTDENIFQYITDDMSWRYVTYLSIFFLL